jgi:REP element-mobilizing transposase RayT
MIEFTDHGPERKSYHVVWQTYRRRPLFKIPAAARFCERELERAAARRGWVVGRAHCAITKVHVVVEVPSSVPRETLATELKRLAGEVVRRSGLRAGGRRPLWEPDAWCRSLSARGLTIVRRSLAARVTGATRVIEISMPGVSELH